VVFLAVVFLLALASALVATSAHAASIRGLVTVRNSKFYLRPITTTMPRSLTAELPVTTSIAIRLALLNLKTDDFVVVSGSLNDTDHDGRPDEVQVDAIESVGLKSLLGTWRSDKWEVVRFEDFTRMSLYRPKFKTEPANPLSIDLRLGNLPLNPVVSLKKLGFAKLKDLNYTLAPEQSAAYSIFLVEKKPGVGPAPVFVGRLQLDSSGPKRKMKLEIFDPKTGEASEVLSLSPVRD
jgi:hypothetical protein